MGKTITEKILGKASGKEVDVGDFVRFDLNKVVLGGLPEKELTELGISKLARPEMVKIVIAGHSGVADNLSRRFSTMRLAKKLGIPRSNIIDLGSGGIEHQVSIEHGWPLPGTVYMQGTDGQTPIHGAMGAVAEPLSKMSENLAVLLTGKSWTHVPPSWKINLRGTLQEGVTARDVFDWILGEIGPDGAMGMMMEFTGPLVDEMSIGAREELCTNAAFAGAFSAIINPDVKTIEYVKTRNNEPFDPLVSDSDAKYVKTSDYDVSTITPQLAVPPKRHTIKPVKDLEGTKIDRAFIGACTNGRLEDLQLAARILKGSNVNPEVNLNVTPATVEILKNAIAEGLIDVFIDAGAVVGTPCCSMCIGSNTPLTGNEVIVATSTCNYPSRMGSHEGQIYLANPATAAASAIAGKIVDPRSYL